MVNLTKLPWQVYLAVIWWGYISYLCNLIWPHSVVMLLMGLVTLLVVLAVCWHYFGFVFPKGDKQFAFRASVGLVVFVLLTGFACNQLVYQENLRREGLLIGPELRQLAETVTYHLLDQSYINYKDFQNALLQGELSPAIRKSLQDTGILAKTNEELEAKHKSLQDSKQITAVHIKAIEIKDKNNGYYPVDVIGRIATQSASSGQIVEKPFCMHYQIRAYPEIQQVIVEDVRSESSEREIERRVIHYSNDRLPDFARRVARHLLDSSYISYEDNSLALVSGELSSRVVRQLHKEGLLPKSIPDMKTHCAQLKKDGHLIVVRFDESTVGEPDKNGLIPVEVKGQVVSESRKPESFKMTLLLGTNTNTGGLVVAELERK